MFPSEMSDKTYYLGEFPASSSITGRYHSAFDKPVMLHW
jgi:hypothetical protein